MSSDRNDSQIEICPDGHHCLNGSKCAENPYDEGSYYCDCEEYVFEVRYEGLYCEHKAEVYCTSHGSSTHSFCVSPMGYLRWMRQISYLPDLYFLTVSPSIIPRRMVVFV